MAQLSLYLDDATMETLRTDAKRQGVSLSKYAAGLIRDHAGGNGWPVGYWEQVYGCLADDDSFVRPDQGDLSLDDDPSLFFV